MNYLEIAKRALREYYAQYDINDQNDQSPRSLEAVLQGEAIELWSDRSGRLFLVSDKEDAQRLMASDKTVQLGETYTAAEARRLVSIGDPAIVQEVAAFKLAMGGTVQGIERDHTSGKA